MVLRILFGEPPDLAEQAFRAVVRLREEGARLILPGIALAEVVWTLERRFEGGAGGHRRRALGTSLAASGIAVESRAWLDALALYGKRNVPFGDAVFAAVVQAAGQAELRSFDEDFDRLPVQRRRHAF